jgi:hypothetical protein
LGVHPAARLYFIPAVIRLHPFVAWHELPDYGFHCCILGTLSPKQHGRQRTWALLCVFQLIFARLSMMVLSPTSAALLNGLGDSPFLPPTIAPQVFEDLSHSRKGSGNPQ